LLLWLFITADISAAADVAIMVVLPFLRIVIAINIAIAIAIAIIIVHAKTATAIAAFSFRFRFRCEGEDIYVINYTIVMFTTSGKVGVGVGAVTG